MVAQGMYIHLFGTPLWPFIYGEQSEARYYGSLV